MGAAAKAAEIPLAIMTRKVAVLEAQVGVSQRRITQDQLNTMRLEKAGIENNIRLYTGYANSAADVDKGVEYAKKAESLTVELGALQQRIDAVIAQSQALDQTQSEDFWLNRYNQAMDDAEDPVSEPPRPVGTTHEMRKNKMYVEPSTQLGAFAIKRARRIAGDVVLNDAKMPPDIRQALGRRFGAGSTAGQ